MPDARGVKLGGKQADVVEHRAGEQEQILCHERDAAPQLAEIEIAHVNVVDLDAARAHVAQP